MTEETYHQEYQQEKQLDEIMLILRELDRSNQARDSDPLKYCTTIETIIINLPRGLKYKVYQKLNELGLKRGTIGAVTDDKRVLYDDLNNYIRDQLEKQKQIWVKKETKTFE